MDLFSHLHQAPAPVPADGFSTAMLTEFALALLGTTLLIAVLWVFQRSFPKLHARIARWRGTAIKPLRIQRVEILSVDRIVGLLTTVVTAVRFVATLVVAYLYLTSLLGLFPWTRELSQRLLSAVLAPLELIGRTFVAVIPNVIAIIVIVAVARVLIKVLRMVFAGMARGAITVSGFHAEWAWPTYKIVRFLVIAFAAIAVFPYIPGSTSPAFQAISVFLGILFSLGSTGAVGNIIAGVILTYMRPFRIGDRVKIADTIGDVVSSELLVTRVRTIKNVDVTIPNAMVMGSHIVNFSSSAQEHGLILHTSVTIGYDAPWRTVHELLVAAAQATPSILKTPAPFVLQTSLDDFYATYELNAYTDRPNDMVVSYSELLQNIQDKFNEGGIEIMSPHYAALRDGNRTTIPERYLPESYAPRAFRVASPDARGAGSQDSVPGKGDRP
jgi:small-conductance mechanosensitive channel